MSPRTAGHSRHLRTVSEVGLKTKMLGGAFIGLPSAALKMQLGPAVNGIDNVELWEPVKTMEFPSVMEFLKKYQARTSGEGLGPLGYFVPPFAYSKLQILGEAVEATESLDDAVLAD
jgi:branched-chain amino acid transport system substrate-binding protein